MSSIRDMERLSNRQLETLKRKQSREIANLEEGHKNYKNEIKNTHTQEIIDLRDQQERFVSAEADKKEKVLDQMRTHLQQTQQMTDKELKNLSEKAQNIKQNEQVKLTVDRERIKSEHELYLEDMNFRYNNQVKKVHKDGTDQIDQMEQKLRSEFSEKEGLYQTKINEQTNEFNTRFKTDGQKYKQTKEEQDAHFKKERISTIKSQQSDLAKMTEVHNGTVLKRDVEFKKGLKDQDQNFEKTYVHHLEVKNKDWERLEKRHEKIVTQMKKDLTENLTGTIARSEDPFYKFTSLKPELKQYSDRIEVAIEVPEHAKNDLQVTLNGKEVVVNFNRRYDDANKTDEGVINKLHKVESYTTRLKTESHLDPKSVKSSYADGVMTYVVKKA